MVQTIEAVRSLDPQTSSIVMRKPAGSRTSAGGKQMLTSLKLLDVMANNSEAIARNWAKDVVQNARTPFYHDLHENHLIPQAADFYRKLSSVYPLKDPYPAIRDFMSKFAVKRFREEVPLQEALYAVILMRRHIWLYAEFQAIFVTILGEQQALESQTRTILIFDYIMYVLTDQYMALMGVTPKKK